MRSDVLLFRAVFTADFCAWLAVGALDDSSLVIKRFHLRKIFERQVLRFQHCDKSIVEFMNDLQQELAVSLAELES